MLRNRATRSWLSRLGLALAGLAAPPLRAAAGEAGSGESKTHTLFMGADIFVETQKSSTPLQDVSGESFAVDVDGRRMLVPAADGMVGLRVGPRLKLSDVSVTIDHLEAIPTYTPARDPHRKFLRELAGDAAMAQAPAASGTVSIADGTASLLPGGAGRSSPQAIAQMQQAAATVRVPDRARGAANADFPADRVGTLQAELNQKRFDALDVTFDVSAERRLDHPYVVIVATYREKGDKPNHIQCRLLAKALEPIDRQARRVEVRQGGFPPGFELESYQVHLYHRGAEVDTSVAAKRVRLTREEAFQYLVVDYVSAHPHATLPAGPAIGALPVDWPSGLDDRALKRILYVKVSKVGRAVAIFVDPLCGEKLDDRYVTSVVQRLRFLPALDRGRPVEGVSVLQLGKLAL